MNMPDVNKGYEGLKISHTLRAKLRKASLQRHLSKSRIIEAALTFELMNVELDEADYRWIAEEIRKNNAKRGA